MREIGCADFLINSKPLKKNAEAFFRLTYWETNPDICKETPELLLIIKIDRIEMPEAERTIKVYTFENTCTENPEIKMNDGTHKIFFKAKKYDTMKSDELKSFFKYLYCRQT